MRRRTIYNPNESFGKWTLVSFLGGGGNGEVWKCKDDQGNQAAIKLLKNIRDKSYNRFLDESKIIAENSDILGVIPMVDQYLPESVDKENVPFYVMPIAIRSMRILKGANLSEKIEAIIDVCRTIKELHTRKIAHRDIKPPNLLFYESRMHLADFGLVDYPAKKDVSNRNEEIGAKWTMAPEMRRESSQADGLKADIYSLAKTLWIILTEKGKGFDGQYSTESVLEIRKYFPKSYTKPIDDLLISSTDNDPQSRPDIQEFISSLENWITLNNDFHERNQSQWSEIQEILFPNAVPSRSIWDKPEDIVEVLRAVCKYDNLNHMFIPDGGGMDLEDVKLATEEGCIELDFEYIYILKPKRLIFESFGTTADWNYFRLELQELEPSGVYETDNDDEAHDSTRIREDLSEITPGVYDEYELVAQRITLNQIGYNIPQTARHVTRWLRGTFVIFSKRSIYNRISATYDGRHNNMDTDKFRAYIQEGVDYYKENA